MDNMGQIREKKRSILFTDPKKKKRSWFYVLLLMLNLGHTLRLIVEY